MPDTITTNCLLWSCCHWGVLGGGGCCMSISEFSEVVCFWVPGKRGSSFSGFWCIVLSSPDELVCIINKQKSLGNIEGGQFNVCQKMTTENSHANSRVTPESHKHVHEQKRQKGSLASLQVHRHINKSELANFLSLFLHCASLFQIVSFSYESHLSCFHMFWSARGMPCVCVLWWRFPEQCVVPLHFLASFPSNISSLNRTPGCLQLKFQCNPTFSHV